MTTKTKIARMLSAIVVALATCLTLCQTTYADMPGPKVGKTTNSQKMLSQPKSAVSKFTIGSRTHNSGLIVMPDAGFKPTSRSPKHTNRIVGDWNGDGIDQIGFKRSTKINRASSIFSDGFESGDTSTYQGRNTYRNFRSYRNN